MKHDAKLVLSNDVYKRIKWLTHNWDKEIGAVGIGNIKQKDEENYFYIEKLFFPEQKVTGASIQFTPAMWKNLIKNPEFMERMGDMCFYWHKHPGSAGSSGNRKERGNYEYDWNDEESTFETFMAPEAKRRWFAFMQTAPKDNGGLDVETRIDVRVPVRYTIEHKDIDLKYELPPEDKSLEEEMKNIIETCIVKDIPSDDKEQANLVDWAKNKNREGINITELKALNQLFSVEEKRGELYMDNDLVNNKATEDDQKASITIGSGRIAVLAGSLFQKVMNSALKNEKTLAPLVRRSRTTDMSTGMVCYDLQPNKHCYNKLQKILTHIFVKYNQFIITDIRKETINTEGKKDETETEDPELNYEILTKSSAKLTGDITFEIVMGELYNVVDIEWVNEQFAKVSDLETKKQIGTIKKVKDEALFWGEELVNKLNDIVIYLDEYDGNDWQYNC